jgi:mono/diheme cytochrome c family protein
MKLTYPKVVCYSLAYTALASVLNVNAAEYPPNIDYGDKGGFIAKRGTEYGRTAILMPIGPLLVNLPEGPGSTNTALNDGILNRTRDSVWDLSDLTNPTLFRQLTCDQYLPTDPGCYPGMPIHAHATVVRFDDDLGALLYARGGEYRNLSYHPESRGQDAELQTPAYYGDYDPANYLHMTAPYYARTYWDYNFNNEGVYAIRDSSQIMSNPDGANPYSMAGTNWEAILGSSQLGVWLGEPIVWWDHLGLAGVTGFASWHGNFLVVASDQQNTGLAIYDVSGFKEGRIPRLVGTYTDQRIQPNGVPVGVGGYWSEPYGANKIVYAARRFGTSRDYPAFYIIDFEDPTTPYVSCELYFNRDETLSQYGNWTQDDNLNNGDASSDPMYVNFQDNYAYVDHFQVDITACEQAFEDETITDSEFANIVYKFDDIANQCDASQYFRPLGQVGIFGGYDWWETPDVNEQGMCFFVTSNEPDTNLPLVSGHRPLANQTEIPIDTFIHIHIPETLRTETVVDAITVTNLSNSTQVGFRYQLAHTGIISVWPDNDLAADTVYQVDVQGIQDFMGNTMVPYSFTFTTNDGDLLNGGTPGLPPTEDESEVVPTYAEPAYFPNKSNQMACSPDEDSGDIWVVNPDNNSVAILNRQTNVNTFVTTHTLVTEIRMEYEAPTSVTEIDSQSGKQFAVTYRDDDKVVFFNAQGNPAFSIDTGHGTQPVTSVSDGTYVYVALYASGELLKIDVGQRTISARLAIGPYPKAMALAGERLLITRFISAQDHGEVYEVDIRGDMGLTHTYIVNKVLVPDDIDHGSGVPNYLASIVIDQAGERAYITAKKDNVDRGTRTGSTNSEPLDCDNTVRPMLITLDLTDYSDANVQPNTRAGTTDFDNAADPSGISFLVNPAIRVHALQGNDNIVLRNEEGNTAAIFSVGGAPQELCSTPRTLYVKNFTDRTVSAIDIAGYLHDGRISPDIQTISTVQTEVLSDAELQGLQIFYHSGIPQMGPEGYMSCASCHFGGGHDGRTWDLTSMGEGLRNTLSLNGASGTRFGNLHWSGNFDEVQDFEIQMEQLNGGEGLVVGQGTFNGENPLELTTTGLSTELDALAAYINGLGKDTVKRSPHRTYTGELSDAAERGSAIFAAENCTSCHAGDAFRDGQMHDVGTIVTSSGQRLNGTLSAIRTPSLIELWDSAPYFHDGRAATLDEVFDVGTHTLNLSAGDISDLVEYLLSIDRELYIDDE